MATASFCRLSAKDIVDSVKPTEWGGGKTLAAPAGKHLDQDKVTVVGLVIVNFSDKMTGFM